MTLNIIALICSILALLLAWFAVEEEKTMKDVEVINARIKLGIVEEQKQQIDDLKDTNMWLMEKLIHIEKQQKTRKREE